MAKKPTDLKTAAAQLDTLADPRLAAEGQRLLALVAEHRRTSFEQGTRTDALSMHNNVLEGLCLQNVHWRWRAFVRRGY